MTSWPWHPSIPWHTDERASLKTSKLLLFPPGTAKQLKIDPPHTGVLVDVSHYSGYWAEEWPPASVSSAQWKNAGLVCASNSDIGWHCGPVECSGWEISTAPLGARRWTVWFLSQSQPGVTGWFDHPLPLPGQPRWRQMWPSLTKNSAPKRGEIEPSSVLFMKPLAQSPAVFPDGGILRAGAARPAPHSRSGPHRQRRARCPTRARSLPGRLDRSWWGSVGTGACRGAGNGRRWSRYRRRRQDRDAAGRAEQDRRAEGNGGEGNGGEGQGRGRGRGRCGRPAAADGAI